MSANCRTSRSCFYIFSYPRAPLSRRIHLSKNVPGIRLERRQTPKSPKHTRGSRVTWKRIPRCPCQSKKSTRNT
ncbi:unnamed protein product, partial [Ixodes pacificus]